jgi:hypothetical protein
MARKGSSEPRWLEELTEQQKVAVLDGAEAVETLADFKRRTFDVWMRIARGVSPLCEWAERKSRSARKNALKSAGYGTLNESTISRLLLMAKHETDVRIWRDSLTTNQRDSWNSPTSICNRCLAVRKAIAEAAKHKPPRRPRTKTSIGAAVERALDVIADAIHAAEDADLRASMVERISKITRPDGDAAPAAAAEPMIVDQHFAALVELLQDEPFAAVQTALNGFSRKLKVAHSARRKAGKQRAETETEKVLRETGENLTRALFGGGASKPKAGRGDR